MARSKNTPASPQNADLSSAAWDQASRELDELWLETQRRKEAMIQSVTIHCVESISSICSLPIQAKPMISHDGRWLQPGQLAMSVRFSIGEVSGEPMETSTLLRLLEEDRAGRLSTEDAPYLNKALSLTGTDKAQALLACQRAAPWIAQFRKGIEELHALDAAFKFLHKLSMSKTVWSSESIYAALRRPDLAAQKQRATLSDAALDPGRAQATPRI